MMYDQRVDTARVQRQRGRRREQHTVCVTSAEGLDASSVCSLVTVVLEPTRCFSGPRADVLLTALARLSLNSVPARETHTGRDCVTPSNADTEESLTHSHTHCALQFVLSCPLSVEMRRRTGGGGEEEGRRRGGCWCCVERRREAEPALSHISVTELCSIRREGTPGSAPVTLSIPCPSTLLI